MRKNLINSLKNFDLTEKKRQTAEILSNLTESDSYKSAQKVALYMATSFEFDLTELFADSSKEILIPKCLPKRQMMFVKFDRNDLERSNFGLLEPRSNVPAVPDLILVPGLGWNAQGFRIGFGGGYYDRYLANFAGPTASVLYDFQQIDFTQEAHDIAVKEIFTYEH